ncbi:Dyp-type peroxidase [Nocardiopsis sp. NPDC050513]|uniref:Dyp-type peroxidase n=1 Tax=Nocardiopsis sp. NPDC050513 TaxID=3364338 RepID=UPI0037B3FC1E
MSSPHRPARTWHGAPPTRRGLIASTLGLAAGAAVAARPSASHAASGATAVADGPPFRGPRQAGVTTPHQSDLLLAAFDLPEGADGARARRVLRGVLDTWTRELTSVLDRGEAPEVLAHARTSRLTATVGLGGTAFDRMGVSRPALLTDFPAFPGDRIDDALSGGDLVVQLCADDAWTVATAADLLTEAAEDTMPPRWRQRGFVAPAPGGGASRNLFGHKDGISNPTAEESERFVWIGEGAERDGTYLVYRRIHMDVDGFEALPVAEQERVIGRHKDTGAPLGQDRETDEPDFAAVTADGDPVIPDDSHMALAHARSHDGDRMLRRGFAYADDRGDQGLLFLAFMDDPRLFTRTQNLLARKDPLHPFTEHRGTGLYLVLPGATEGRPLGTGVL